MIDDEVPKYKKKSQKVTPKKADHKHEAAFCVYEYTTDRYTIEHGHEKLPACAIGTYCTICGKILTVTLKELNNPYVEKTSENTWNWLVPIGCKWSELGLREINPETRTLPTFVLNDYWKQKFINLEELKCEKK